MKCRHERAPEHAAFCPDCGARLVQVRDEVKIPVPRHRGKKWSASMEINGERVYLSADSEEEYYAKANAARSGLIEIKKAAPRIKLGTAIDRYLKDNENLISPSTLNSYLSYRKTRFTKYMDRDVNTINWQRMVNEEAADYAPKTVINAWDLVCLSLEYCNHKRPEIKLPKKHKQNRKWLDFEQIQTFTDAVYGKPYELGALLALHGLRRSEILYLTADDVDTEKGIIRVKGARVIGRGNKAVDKEYNKTSASTRTVHIMMPRLTELVKDREGRLITTNPTTLYGGINYLCKKNGLPEIGVHGLRHSFCSLARHLNWDELTVMREGGWDDPKVVHEIYTHLAEQDANEDVKRMKEFYERGTSKSRQEN